MRNNQKPYTIHMTFGQGDLGEIIDDLARQVVSKNMGAFHAGNPRVKKSTSIGRAI
ncbi:hypothetical protein [Aneurinibacillus danicus]|uniref:Uncharacterized protein n=1 Tax=Aneurinibacillus danicus TaxID=267746 RepID=A0A511V5F5_9BACL|nr:hypothetical protein [Aneurinibacillus danicus]GEN32973.1 hypothetical protein ADA01nite_04330 [Aneurinibacillus danicus]